MEESIEKKLFSYKKTSSSAIIICFVWEKVILLEIEKSKKLMFLMAKLNGFQNVSKEVNMVGSKLIKVSYYIV